MREMIEELGVADVHGILPLTMRMVQAMAEIEDRVDRTGVVSISDAELALLPVLHDICDMELQVSRKQMEEAAAAIERIVDGTCPVCHHDLGFDGRDVRIEMLRNDPVIEEHAWEVRNETEGVHIAPDPDVGGDGDHA